MLGLARGLTAGVRAWRQARRPPDPPPAGWTSPAALITGLYHQGCVEGGCSVSLEALCELALAGVALYQSRRPSETCDACRRPLEPATVRIVLEPLNRDH